MKVANSEMKKQLKTLNVDQVEVSSNLFIKIVMIEFLSLYHCYYYYFSYYY